MSSLAERLKELRTKRSMTQSDLADDLSMSHSTVAMWEIGKRDPDSNMIRKIANYFNVTTDYLLGLSDISVPGGSLNKDDVYIAYLGGPPEELEEDEAEALKLELEKFRAMKAMREIKKVGDELSKRVAERRTPPKA